MSSKEMPSKGNTSLSNLVGIGSKKQVVDLEEEMKKANWWRLIEKNQSRYISGLVVFSNAAVLMDNFMVGSS